MVKTDIEKYSKRVIFPNGKQYLFLNEVREKMNCSWSYFASKIGVHPRTLNDWKREAYSIPLDIFNKLSLKVDKKLINNIKIKDPFWYTFKGSKVGWKVVMKKYGYVGGDPEYRKKKWREWWEREGKRKCSYIGKYKPIHKSGYSKKLAEFVGIVMGDGGISDNQITITLHSKDDKDYSVFVKNLGEQILKVPISIYNHKDEHAMALVISRKKLVNFFVEKLGLKKGHKIKQGLDIPSWIKKNTEFQKACIRGLVDTDGCIFNEVHHINGKIYSYKRLNFTSASPYLRQSVFSFFEELNLLPKMRNNRSVQIEKKEKIEEYFKIIGTSNPKHKRRFMEEYR